jgi:5-methylcytosine-specific restriction endonuclease McrA
MAIAALLRQQMYKESKTCGYCGAKLTKQTRQIDHIHPQCAGGNDERPNLLLACRRCNRQKGKKSQRDYINFRLAQVKLEQQTLERLYNDQGY